MPPVPPVLGRPSPAAEAEPVLRSHGDGSSASWRAEGASLQWCSVRAASVAGVRHRLAGQGSDDAFAWAHDGRRLAVAVADGVGSVAGSAGAAQRAARAAVAAAIEAKAADPVEAVRVAAAAANEAAGGGGATTLVVAVVQAGGRSAVGRVGDSSALVLGGSGPAVELFDGPDPEAPGSPTAALPVTDPAVEMADFELASGSVLVLASDGVADPWRDGPNTVAPAMAEVLRVPPSPLELLRLADFSRQGCHDDRTLVAVWLHLDDAERRASA